ncbi:MAG TPA: hypothetical protein VIV11_16835 [Kofleriaceae bacterium]
MSACAFASLFTGCMAGGGFSVGGKSSASAGAGGASPSSSPSSSSSSGGGGAVTTGEAPPELDDFSFVVKEYTGDYARAFVTSKLTTFKVPPACWKKMQDPNGGALHTASFYTRDILEYSKAITGDDWSDIEDQNKEKNVKLIAPMVDDFKNRFSVTVNVDGDDCDNEQNSLWLRYWYHIGTSVKDYPPKSGRAFITLTVTPTVKNFTIDVDDSGSTWTITAPRDIEPKNWQEEMQKPFRRRSSKM